MTVRAGVDTDSGKVFVEVAETIGGADGYDLVTSAQGKITSEQARMLAQQLEQAAETIDEFDNGDFE